jgi:hypothetical protein
LLRVSDNLTNVNLNCLICVLFLLLNAQVGFAQDEIVAVPNRPTVSTTAQPVQRGVLETEWGVDAASSHQDVNGLFKFGLTTNFELRLANNPLTADSGTQGFGDTSAGFKYRVTRDSGHEPSIAFMYMIKAPTAGNVLGSGEVDHTITLLVSKDLGKHHFDFNTALNLLGNPHGGFDHDVLNALAWSHPVRGNWSATAELSGVTSPNAGVAAGTAQFIAAAIYTVRPRLVFDIGMMGRLSGQIPHAMFITGVTYSLADLYHAYQQIDSPPSPSGIH